VIENSRPALFPAFCFASEDALNGYCSEVGPKAHQRLSAHASCGTVGWRG